MGSVYRKTATKPLPAESEIFVRKGTRFARWVDTRGKIRTAPITTGRDGSNRIVLTAATYTAKYRDGRGLLREAATGCRSKDGALAVLKDLLTRAELVKANVISAEQAAVANHQHTPIDEHLKGYLTN